MEKTQYQQWLDGRLIDYPELGELAWLAALDKVKRAIGQRDDHAITRENVLYIIEQLSK